MRAVMVSGCAGLVLILLSLIFAPTAEAVPYFARKFDAPCSTCHTVVPKLNRVGLDFRARGYRLPGREPVTTFPVSVWLAGRHENRTDRGVDNVFIDKVELISGGALGDRVSYFIEWRALSLGLNNEGGLNDRSGRFEDAFVSVQLADNLSATVGQFRLFDQFDVSLRLSGSTPVALGSGVRGAAEKADTPRQAALRGFSPAGRSPALRLSYRVPSGASGARRADGWTFHASLPFPGELSIPLTEEARQRASFEFDGSPKGVYLEAYHRWGLSSAGGAAFLDGDRQLYTLLGSFDPGWWNTTLAVSSAVYEGDADWRLSWWNEIQPWRGVNLGLRLDDTESNPASYHVYADLQWASRRGVLWLLVEQRFRDGGDRTVVQLNAIF